jgi:chromate reductase
MPATIHILGFAGSLRKNSYNRAALKVAQSLVPEGAEMEIITLDEIPLYNQDYENDEPPSVRTFKEKIRLSIIIQCRGCLKMPLTGLHGLL